MNSDLSTTENISSIFQENVCIRGDLELSQPLLLDGKLYGNIISSSHVIVGEKGYVEGKIEADKVTMWGFIKGDINAKSLCILEELAKVEGDIASEKLSMKVGATFVGSAKIKRAESAPIKKEPETTNVKHVNRLKPAEEAEKDDLNVNVDL